jgi:hypothetical protein
LTSSDLRLWVAVKHGNLKVGSTHYYIARAQSLLSGACGVTSDP